ncbi:hypothetical protein G7062_06145 [Erysipelothrix sp. HDW6C]|uniref:DUF6179 domain-containing protein n=1 Tax=Erysipelothrix sp. HDW6C TaxID=2714930 RepID=UPI00140C8CE4|nr:DUF6179 domain-containing protein [Erysipelothrix sp. HDW6C]QIK69897.1 hypothetical protein G7062_06145 [Erysipelothrix sp. HDW6C]
MTSIRRFYTFQSFFETHPPLQKQLMFEFQEIIEAMIRQYNHNLSTVISRQLYFEFKESVYYVLDHGFRNYDAIHLNTVNICRQIYSQGWDIIHEDLREISNILSYLHQHPLPLDNERFNNIIAEQLPGFLEAYDVRFGAIFCEYDLDYPLIDGIPMDHNMYDLTGSDLVLEYAKRYLIEYDFLLHQNEKELNFFIHTYEQAKGIATIYLGLNYVDILLTQMILNTMQFSRPANLLETLNSADFDSLVESSNPQRILESELIQLTRVYGDYFHRIQPFLWARIKIAIKNNSFHDLYISTPSESESFTFHDKKALSDDEFKNLISQLQQCSSPQQQIDLLFRSSLSLRDLMDVLDHDVFFSDGVLYDCFHHLDPHVIGYMVYLIWPTMFVFNQTPTKTDFRRDDTVLSPWQHTFQRYIVHLNAEMFRNRVAIAKGFRSIHTEWNE